MKKIVILGASIHQLPLIKKCRDMGFETHVFAWQIDDPGEYEADYFYPVSIRNKDAIIEECKRLKPEGIVTISSDIGAQVVAHIADALCLKGHVPEYVDVAVNKIRSRSLLQKEGIRVPHTTVVGDTLPNCDIKYPVVVKPSDRSGGKGVHLCKNKDELKHAISLSRELSFEGKAIIEEYLGNIFYTAECISNNGKHLVIAITENHYKYENGAFCPETLIESSQIQDAVLNRFKDQLYKILNIFNFKNGASNIEFFIDGEEMIVLETSPCMRGEFVGTHLVPLATGFDYLKSVIDLSTSENVTFELHDEIDSYQILCGESSKYCDCNEIYAGIYMRRKD